MGIQDGLSSAHLHTYIRVLLSGSLRAWLRLSANELDLDHIWKHEPWDSLEFGIALRYRWVWHGTTFAKKDIPEIYCIYPNFQ